MKKFKDILIEERGPAVWVSLNRPELKNAIDLETAGELLAAIRQAVSMKGRPVVVLTGKGDSFSAGGDIRKMGETRAIKKFFLEISRLAHTAVGEIRKTDKLVLSAAPGYVGGVALGLYLAADLRIAAQTARFNAATIRIGLVANGGATWLLPRLVGMGRAAEILYLGEIVSAARALEIGLVNRVVAPADFEAQTQSIAELLASGPRAALARLKKTLAASLDSGLSAQLERERQAIAWSSTTADFREGIRAFLEKRPPRFN